MDRIERLEKILNKTSGNPYHDSEGKFTFSPSSFKNTTGKDAEVTDNPKDWYLTDLSRKNINKVPEISSTKELKDYLSSNGIKSDIDNPAIKKHEDYENIEFDALKKQASGIVASVEFCKAVFGKESLSKLKEIKFYSSESETTGSFDVMLKGEKPSETNGTLELSTDITNRGILHEFIHVVQDSTKRKSQDCVLWSKEILDKTGANSKAYTGASSNHLPAEQLADLISFGIANGKNLEDVSKVINYIKKNKTENSIKYNSSVDYGNNKLNKILNSQKENLDYRYDVKAYKEYLKEWIKHKDEPEYLENGVLSFFEFWEHDIDYEFEDYNKILKLIDEYNKKKELVTNGGPGSGNHNPGQGRGVGKPSDSIDVSKYSTYEDFEQDMFRGENRKENIEKLKEQGINSKDKMYLYFVNEKFKKQKITQMSLDDAKDTILENIPKSVAEGWFIKADSSYKKKIVQLIVENDNLRSASLSLAYETYKELVNKNIGFNDFLNKELDLYRGDPEGKKFIEADSTSFISYTPFEDMAKKFGKVITKKTIKPKETLGVLRQVGEFEFLVPTFNQKKDVHKSKNASVRMNDLLQKMDKILNGGPNSGNPYHDEKGRFTSGPSGAGKPADGHTSKSATQYSSKNYLSKKEYENIVNYTSEDNFTDEELDAIAGYAISMGYGASCELNQAIREDYSGEIIEKEDIAYPEDDSQIVTWKENREFIEQQIKDKKKIDSLEDEIISANSAIRNGELSDEKEIEKLKTHISELKKEKDNLSKTLRYYEFENYIKNYEKGLYKNIKDDQKMWTIDENKLSKISVVKLREKQKSEPKKFDEVVGIPRLSYAMYDGDEPINTDTLLKKYQRDFKNLDKLDNIIKDKGFVLDKDITVTRRVANAKVIESQIKNKGEYTQNGITSVTAAKSIAKKMPSGVNMGDDLLRITIPAGTRVISTYNAFARDTQKTADEYNNGKLTEEDNMNLQMIKSQNELILPSGSKFISPNGNNISKNEDGSYQLILKVEKDKTSENSLNIIDYLRNNLSAKSYFRSQRLFAILNKVNRGNPYHDEKGRFASKNGGYYKSSFVTKDGKEIDEYCSNFKELSKVLIKNEVKATKEKVLGKELLGRRIDILNSDSIMNTVNRNAEDKKRVEEIKYQIETKKKSGIIPIIIRDNNPIDIVDGTHTLEAFMRLKEEGKKYYIPILITTPELVEKWENKFESIEDLQKSQKSLIKVREHKE